MQVAGFKDVLAGPSLRRGGGKAGEPPAKPPRHVTVLRFFFALLLLASAVGKLLDIRGFAAVLGTYQVFPETLLLPRRSPSCSWNWRSASRSFGGSGSSPPRS